jgi:N-methylhydantoinase B
MTVTDPSGPVTDHALENDILRYAILEIAREMNDALMRSAFSPVVRDQLDCTTAVLMRNEGAWELVASWEGSCQHAFTTQHICNFVMDEWDLSRTRPGDVILVNDPWRGAIHQSDINLLRPVFVDGEAEFVLLSTSHLVDLGGPIPGGFSNGAQTSFEEQLKFPPILLYAEDVPVRSMFNYILENVRVPASVLGDLRALHGCLVVGERRLRDVFDRHGVENVRRAGLHAIETTEANMRRGIAAIPDGDYRVEDFLDDDGVTGEQIPIVTTVKVRGDSIELDFSGTGRQPLGNNGSAWAEATRAIEAVKLLVDPHTPVNSGTLRPVETLLPPGSAVCVLPPSSCSNHVDIGSRAINNVERALGLALGRDAIACDSGTVTMLTLGGIDTRPGRAAAPWGGFALTGGGWGGTPTSDGISFCIVPMGNCRTSVLEHVELETPVLVAQHEIMPDSAGAGQHRGGFGGVYTVYALADTVVTISSDRVRTGAPGVLGGGTGMPAYGWYIENFDVSRHLAPFDLDGLEPLFGLFTDDGIPDPDHGKFCVNTRYRTSKVSNVLLKAGDGLRMVNGGGGGWGDPLARDVRAVAADVRNGLHTAEFAAEAYGVVISDSRPDLMATERLRTQLSQLRERGAWRVPVACAPNWNLGKR